MKKFISLLTISQLHCYRLVAWLYWLISEKIENSDLLEINDVAEGEGDFL